MATMNYERAKAMREKRTADMLNITFYCEVRKCSQVFNDVEAAKRAYVCKSCNKCKEPLRGGAPIRDNPFTGVKGSAVAL